MIYRGVRVQLQPCWVGARLGLLALWSQCLFRALVGLPTRPEQPWSKAWLYEADGQGRGPIKQYPRHRSFQHMAEVDSPTFQCMYESE